MKPFDRPSAFYCLSIGRIFKPASIAFIMLLSIASPALAAYPQTMTVSNPYIEPPRPSDDPLWSEAFGHWDNRSETKEVKAAMEIFEKLAAKYPRKTVSHLWLMKAYYVMGIREGGKRAEWLLKSASEADKALAIDPGNKCALYWKFPALVQARPLTPSERDKMREARDKSAAFRQLVAPDDDPMWKDAINAWDGRWDKNEAMKAYEIFGKLEKKYPNHIEPKLWLARSAFWLNFRSEDTDERAHWALVASKHGQSAMAKEPRNPDACWWTAISLGFHASNTTYMNYAKYALDCLMMLQVIIEEDPMYYYGGVQQFLAFALARAGKLARKAISIIGYPMPEAERLVTFAIEYEPRFLVSHYALAELYAVQGKTALLKSTVDLILNADPKALPMLEPENRRAQAMARDLLKGIK